MIDLFDTYVKKAIKKAEASLVKIFRYRARINRISDWETQGALEAGKIAKVVFDAVRQDSLSHGNQLSREFPIHIGNAANMSHHVLPRAKIHLVDSTTSGIKDDWDSKSILIQAKAMRPFLPQRGTKNDAKYVRYIRPFLDGNDIENPDSVAGMISKTEVRGGTYCPVDDFVFRQYAPKIALLYCSWDQFDRKILMIRPSNKDLNGVAYKAYCDVVTESIMLRHGWDFDFDTIRWNRVDIANSMAVADSQLMVREDDLLPEDLHNISTEESSLFLQKFLLIKIAA